MEARLDPEAILREGLRRGLSELEVVVVSTERVTASIVSGEIKPVLFSARTTYGLRAAIGRRVAGISVGDLGTSLEEALRDLERAVRSSPEDPYWQGFPPKIDRGVRSETYSKNFDYLEPEKAVELAKLVVDSAVERGRVVGADRTTVMEGLVELARVNIRVVNTNGVDVSERCSVFGAYGSVKSVFGGTDSTYDFSLGSRRVAEEELVKRVVEAVDYTTLFRGPTTPESGVYPLVLAPRVAAEVLTAALIPAVSGLNIVEGRSPLKGKIGAPVLNEKVTIRDDPTLPLHYGSRSFDDEGVGVYSKTVFDRGVFATPLTNYYVSKRLNMESTGNGFRTLPGASTAPAPTNVVLENGSGGLEEFTRELKRGIVVYSTIGSWMSNFVSGQVYFTVTHGLLVDGGRVRPVKSFVVAGNIYEWLGGKLVEVGSDAEVNANYVTPSLYIAEAKVSGG